MKHTKCLFLLILMSAPIFSIDHETGGGEPDCCGLGNLFYNAAKHTGRNDFLYLAHTNSSWFLRKKLQSEEFENRDKYYLRVGRVVNGTEISLYHTPLQEAIKMGNLEAVQLLCSVGADMHKKIKNALDLQPEEATTESHGGVFILSYPKDEETGKEEIESFKNKFYVGCSALELSERMLKESEDKPAERQEIAEFLSKHNKND